MNRMNENANKLSKANKVKRALAVREDKVRRVQAAKFRRGSIVFCAVLMPMIVLALVTVDYLYRPNSFALQELEFSGPFNRVQLTEVEQKTSAALQGNFFTVDLEKIRNEVMTVSWVKEVNVRRKWPNSIELAVSEYIPHMRWGKEGWVARSGHIVFDNNLMIDAQVPTLNGDKQHVAELFAFAQLWQKQLAQNQLVLEHIDRSPSRAWMIRFSHSVAGESSDEVFEDQASTTLLLGSDDVQNRLDRFLRMYSQNVGILKASNLVDARYPNGLAIVPVQEDVNEKNVSHSNENVADKRLSSL